jgi:hypothetical protein
VTSRRGLFTINLAKKDSRVEVEALLPVLQNSLVFPAGTLEVSLEGARSREDRSPSPRPAPGVGSVEGVSTQRTPRRFLSEYFNGSCCLTDE